MLFRFWVFPDCTFLDISNGEGGLWVRPLAMWQEAVERDGVTYPHRFTYLGD